MQCPASHRCREAGLVDCRRNKGGWSVGIIGLLVVIILVILILRLL
jgi:uncharacterized integral membrane protein